MRSFVILFLLLFGKEALFGQTCCSGGVPIASNIGMPPSDAKVLQLALAYDLNVLETLKAGSQKLDDSSRSRKTHSSLLEFSYGFSNRITADVLLSFVRQERTIDQGFQTDFIATNGVGDAVVLLKYNIFKPENKGQGWIGCLGLKLPVGSSTKKSPSGVSLNADLQPGSGTLDYLLWSQFYSSLAFRPSMVFSINSSYTLKGTNDTYLGSQAYTFGNEFQFSTSFSEKLFVASNGIDVTLGLRYRYQTSDFQNDFILPSTGGHWLFVTPSLNYWLNDSIAFDFALTLPAYAQVFGTQVTPSYRFRLGGLFLIN